MPFTEEWSMYINHNGMATNVANTLTSHYSNLSTSTERLSSGMRINSAADDAAGLAISELMRADIAALNQGVRNANDAISLIQTADGALGVIDEKLIRMKELAEQASTGTYDSTQRLMIDSEYQQMASEITRIANATDFNGTKLLDGTLSGVHDGSQMTSTGALKVHFGTGNDSAEDYYYIEIGDVTAQALGLGSASTYNEDRDRIIAEYKTQLEKAMKGWDRGNAWQKSAYDQIDDLVTDFTEKLYAVENIMNGNAQGAATDATLADAWNALSEQEKQFYGRGLPSDNMPPDADQYAAMSDSDKQKVLYAYTRALVNSWSDGDPQRLDADGNIDPAGTIDATVDSFGDNGGTDLSLTDITTVLGEVERVGNTMDPAVGTDARAATSAAIYDALHAMSVGLETKWDAAGRTIATQEDAQLALTAINNAIIEKDKVRAHLGAIQNRLENTITNLNVQAENLQAAESRIRDVDVATEMTEFTRQQILTQTAVAMLSQANSLPQMAMQLVGG